MADVDVTQELPLPIERPRPVTSGPLAWLRANLFNSIANTAMNQTGRAVECIAILMSVYLTLSLLTSGLMNWYNARVAIQER